MLNMTRIDDTARLAREAAREDSGRFGAQEHTAPDLSLDDPGTVEVQWVPGDESAMIASGTNPWVQRGGEPVNLIMVTRGPDASDCDSCRGDEFAGAILSMDTAEGIQRCDECEVFEGDLEASQHVARVLTERTGEDHTVWFEQEGAPAVPTPFVFNKNYRDHEQVRPYMEEFLRVYDEVEQPGRGFAYDDDFVGRLSTLKGATQKDEKTAIYMLQNLRRLDQEGRVKDAFIEAGGRPLTVEDLADGKPRRGTLVRAGFYMGGTGWEVHHDVRVTLWQPHADGPARVAITEKGKRKPQPLFDGDFYFRDGSL